MVIVREPPSGDLDLVALLADEAREVRLQGVFSGGDADKGEIARAVGDLGLRAADQTGDEIVTVTPGRAAAGVVDHGADQPSGGRLRVHEVTSNRAATTTTQFDSKIETFLYLLCPITHSSVISRNQWIKSIFACSATAPARIHAEIYHSMNRDSESRNDVRKAERESKKPFIKPGRLVCYNVPGSPRRASRSQGPQGASQ